MMSGVPTVTRTRSIRILTGILTTLGLLLLVAFLAGVVIIIPGVSAVQSVLLTVLTFMIFKHEFFGFDGGLSTNGEVFLTSSLLWVSLVIQNSHPLVVFTPLVVGAVAFILNPATQTLPYSNISAVNAFYNFILRNRCNYTTGSIASLVGGALFFLTRPIIDVVSERRAFLMENLALGIRMVTVLACMFLVQGIMMVLPLEKKKKKKEEDVVWQVFFFFHFASLVLSMGFAVVAFVLMVKRAMTEERLGYLLPAIKVVMLSAGLVLAALIARHIIGYC